MRFLSLAVLLLAATVATAQSNFTFTHEEARISVVLPEGFEPNGALEENLPDFSLFSFFDRSTGRLVTVSQHSYFTPDQREAWLSGAEPQRRLGHIERLEPTDPSAFPLPAGAAYKAYFEGASERAIGYVLFGCDETRCYRVDVAAAASDFEADPNLAADLFAGVRFLD